MLLSAAAIFSTLLASLPVAAGQTFTSCNPLQKTCPSNPGLMANTLTTDFTKGPSSDWTVINASTIGYAPSGIGFTINSRADSPTLGSSFYMLFGYVEVRMRAAPGTGICSAIVLQSDDLDEIDWEILGGVPNSVQTNFFGKGDTSTYDRGQTHGVSASTTTFHTYAIEWTSSAITWSIDGKVVRTVLATDASTKGGKFYPQTPAQVRVGNWAAGASPNKGTVAWAGGEVDFNKGPYTMEISYVNIVNYNPASSYTYGDNSGSWQSIKMASGASVVGTNVNIKAGANSGSNQVVNVTSSVSSTATASSTSLLSSTSSMSTSTRNSTNPLSIVSSSTTGTATSSAASASATRTNDATKQIAGNGNFICGLALALAAGLWL